MNRMISGLKNQALRAGYAMARKSGLPCPDCGEPLSLPDSLPDHPLTCGTCPWAGSWTRVAFRLSQGDLQRIENTKPPKCRIAEHEIDGGREWTIPARGGVNFFLFFGAFFGGLPLVMMTLLLFGSGESESLAATVFAVLFLLVFVTVGGTIFRIGLRRSAARYFLRIASGAALLERRFLGRRRYRTIPGGELAGVGLSPAYTSNNQQVYDLVLQSRGGEVIRFGSSLPEREQRWLIGRMMDCLPAEEAKPASVSAVGLDDRQDRPPADEARDVSARSLSEGFVVEIRGKRFARGMLPVAIFLVLFGGVFAWIGFAEAGFPFHVAGIGMAVVGVVLLGVAVRISGRQRSLTVEGDQLLVESRSKDRRLARDLYRRSDFERLDVASSGHSNGQPRYSVNLTGREVELRIFSWASEEQVAVVAPRIEAWLGTAGARESGRREGGEQELPSRSGRIPMIAADTSLRGMLERLR